MSEEGALTYSVFKKIIYFHKKTQTILRVQKDLKLLILSLNCPNIGCDFQKIATLGLPLILRGPLFPKVLPPLARGTRKWKKSSAVGKKGLTQNI